jgi:hypothetical protein
MNNREQITLVDGRLDIDPYATPNWTETLSDSPRYIANKPIHYNAAGVITSPTKIWSALVDPDTGDGYSIDISSAGFTSVQNVLITVNKSTATAADVPRVSVKSASATAVVVNIVASNTAAFVETGVTLYVRVEGV